VTDVTDVIDPLARLSLNQATIKRASVAEAVDACAAAGISGIGLWRDPVTEVGVHRAAELVRGAGLAVTSLCRGGFFGRPGALDDNRRSIQEAVALGTNVLVLVSGGLRAGSRDLDASRAAVADGLAALAPLAAEHGVRLAIEPLHPMFCADRCVVSTIGQALELARAFPADQVGVMLDAYHLWWDPKVYDDIARAGDRIAGFQVSDWVVPLPAGVVTGRGLMGDGCIELRRLRQAVDGAGYTGPVEVEIFDDDLWGQPPDVVCARIVTRYLAHGA
jgi:sugar phosphate isomerase/epimerase